MLMLMLPASASYKYRMLEFVDPVPFPRANSTRKTCFKPKSQNNVHVPASNIIVTLMFYLHDTLSTVIIAENYC